VAVFAGFAAYGALAPDITSALTGLLTGAYLYTGLTQRPGSSMWAVPIGGATFAIMNGGVTQTLSVRLLISAGVWTTVVELLAAFTAEQHRLTDALNRAATSDALTGIPNRRDLESRLTALRPGDAIVLCDLDHFKQVNDVHGHHVGDRMLADFGALLRTCLRTEDYCARYGGEEFLLLLPDTDLATAQLVVQRLHDAWHLMTPATTFSAGIAASRADRTPADTVNAADEALYQAKAAGRDTLRAESPASVGAAARRDS
jgi:diguanylate cyclase (GGDEF)-like protein